MSIPTRAATTTWPSIIPPWAHEGRHREDARRLKDPKQRDRMKKDIKDGIPGWYNHYTAVGGDWSRMLIAATSSYEGLTMDRIIAERAKNKKPTPDPLDEFFDLLIEEGGSRLDGLRSSHREGHEPGDAATVVLDRLRRPGATPSTARCARGHPHPRSFGTFPRVLGVYVREQGLLRLEDAVRKMTSLNAAKLGIIDRGLLRPGMYADMTRLRCGAVIDRSTYTDPFHYSEGIEYVIVNGQLVLDKGKHTGALPGKGLRKR